MIINSNNFHTIVELYTIRHYGIWNNYCCLSCSVSESLDDVLQAVNKAKKTSSVTTHGGRGLFDEDDEDVAASDMQTNEILKYIQQNTQEDDDPDLF